MRSVYLDHQTTTPVLPEVLEAMRPYFTEHFGAPASLHSLGLRARDALEQARAQSASLINASSPEDILFTSGGTEAVNLAVKGAALAGRRRGKHIVVGETEHLAVLRSAEFLESQGFEVTRVPVDAEGVLSPEDVRAAVTDQTVLICAHHVNHELGTIQPIADLSRIAGERGIPLFVDATASAGWLPIDVRAMGPGLLALSPHRFYGPKGVGMLYRRRDTRLAPLMHGGSQEDGRRAGTENLPAIVGAGAAAALAVKDLPARVSHTAALQSRLWDGIARRIPHVKFNGPAPGPRRISTSVNISVEFVEGEGLLLSLDMQGIAAASGPGCISKSLAVSHVLRAIGLDPALAQGNLMFSLGRENTADEVDYTLDTLEKVINKLRAMSPLWDEFKQGRVASLIPAAATARSGL